MASENQYQSTKSWCFFKVKVNGSEQVDMTRNLARVIITNDINNSFGTIHLFFFADNQLWIENNLYPDAKITLEIWYADEKGNPTAQPIIFNLLILENNIDLPSKMQDNISKKRDGQRRTSCVTCIVEQAFKIMSAVVNRLWEGDGSNEEVISPYDAVMQLIKDVGISSKEIEDTGKNNFKLDQLIIPPMSFASALNHINDMYGIYMNQTLKYVQYNGTFTMWDIVEHFNKNKDGEIVLHKLPNFSTDKSPEQATKLASQHSNHFVCYDNVETINVNNDVITKRGYRQSLIYHPASDIAYINTKNIMSEHVPHGIISGNPDMKINSLLADRYVVDYDRPGMMKQWRGFEPADNPMLSKINEQLIGMNGIRFNIQRQIKIHHLIRIGHVLYLKPYSQHEKYGQASYEGAYLITQSTVELNRMKNGAIGDNVDCHCTIVGYRTNQSYK